MDYRPLRTTRPFRNLQQTRPGWYTVVRNEIGPVQVTIYDEIGFFGVSADAFKADLAAIQGDVELHINSPGGDVFDGVAIFNALRQRKGTVAVIVDGLAASAASFIAQAASPGRLAIAPHAAMMIHEGFAMCIGNAADMRKLADDLEKCSDNIAGIYADRTGKPASYWRDQMRAETWLYDNAAVAEGLADYVLGQEAPQNKWDLSVYLNPPQNADGNHAPMTGTHSHSHPAYGAQGDDGSHSHEHSHDGDANHHHAHAPDDGDGAPMEMLLRNADMHGDHVRVDPDGDGDCDACPEGDTDHDYWSEDGEQLKPLPGHPMTGNKAAYARFLNEKYSQDDRDRMAGNGHAMPDGSYPIEDEEDLDNAIHAVGRGGADHDAIRRHVIKRAKALGKSDKIPDNWNADGSLQTSADNQVEREFLAIVAGQMAQLNAGKEQ